MLKSSLFLIYIFICIINIGYTIGNIKVFIINKNLLYIKTIDLFKFLFCKINNRFFINKLYLLGNK